MSRKDDPFTMIVNSGTRFTN